MSDEVDFIAKSTEVPPLPEKSISNALGVLNSGKLFRYGENNADGMYVSQLETMFAEMIGSKFAIALNSGGSAIYIALKSAGVLENETVALNVFTLAPVPGALENAGVQVLLLDVDTNLTLSVDDLEQKLQMGNAKALVLSHMRGHIGRMDEIERICKQLGVILIEDCAHAMGAKYDGRMVGTFGDISCFSFQTYKQVNAGEGGILVTDDPDIAAKAILYSGSYLLYSQHANRPSEAYFSKYRGKIPNYSLRMNELCASVLPPQLLQLEERNNRWRDIYATIDSGLRQIEGITTIEVLSEVLMAPTSIQFHIADVKKIEQVIAKAFELGLKIKWFGSSHADGFTSNSTHWEYLSDFSPISPHLIGLCDIRLPVTLSDGQCQHIIQIVAQSIGANR